MLFEQLKHAVSIFQAAVHFGHAVFVHLKRPGRLVIGALFRIVAGEQAVIELVVFVHQKRSVGVLGDVFFLNQSFVEDVLDHPPEKGDVGSGPQRRIDIGLRGGTGEPGVYADQLGPGLLGPGDVLK